MERDLSTGLDNTTFEQTGPGYLLQLDPKLSSNYHFLSLPMSLTCALTIKRCISCKLEAKKKIGVDFTRVCVRELMDQRIRRPLPRTRSIFTGKHAVYVSHEDNLICHKFNPVLKSR